MNPVQSLPSVGAVLTVGALLFLGGLLVGNQLPKPERMIFGCDDFVTDLNLIEDQRLAEAKRVAAGKPLKESWLTLPDTRSAADRAHMRTLQCVSIPDPD